MKKQTLSQIIEERKEFAGDYEDDIEVLELEDVQTILSMIADELRVEEITKEDVVYPIGAVSGVEKKLVCETHNGVAKQINSKLEGLKSIFK